MSIHSHFLRSRGGAAALFGFLAIILPIMLGLALSETTAGQIVTPNVTPEVRFYLPIFLIPPGPVEQLAFASTLEGDNKEIYLINSDGSGLTRLTDHPSRDADPAWSPDGNRLAFTTDRHGNFDLYLMNVDGSGTMRLTHDGGFDCCADWSPDGTHLAFYSDWPQNLHDINVINADGTGRARLTNTPNVAEPDPAWSPDGSQIAYSANGDIFVMDADGSNVRQLTSWPGYHEDPDWSPDGRYIVYSSGQAGDEDIYRMDSDGSHAVQLTSDPARDFEPSWSASGLLIAFTSNRDGQEAVYIMRSNRKGLRRLTNFSIRDYGPAWRPASSSVP